MKCQTKKCISILLFHFSRSYSYGDSAGISPNFPFNPGVEIGNQLRGQM